MAERILSRCGYRCDLCLAYRPNVEANPDNRQKLSDGWFTWFGFRIEPEHIICDGCMEENPTLIDTNCPVRPCVLQRGLENCAHCARTECSILDERLVRAEFTAKARAKGATDDDYRCFIQPYENERRLKAIRAAREFGFT